MTIHDQIFNMIARNPGITKNEIIDNCINKEFAAKFLQDLIDDNKVECVRDSNPNIYKIPDSLEKKL